MVAEIRPDADETRHRVLLGEVLEVIRKRQIRQPVAVIGEKHLVVGDVPLDRPQTLADVGCRAGFDEGDPPIVNV